MAMMIVAAWSLGIIALAAIAWGLFGDRSRGRARCPSCWYSLEGAGPVCPECGTSSEPSERSRARRRWWPVVIGVALAGGALYMGAGRERLIAWAYRLVPAWWVEKRVAAGASGEYEVVVLKNIRPDWMGMPRRVEIRHRGHTVFAMEAAHPQVGEYGMPPEAKAVPGLGVRTDLNGNGLIDVWISDPSPGTGAIGEQYLFDLDEAASSPSVRPACVIPYVGWFEDVDGDGTCEFVAVDNTFAYWWTPGFANPYVKVALEVKEHGWRPRADLTRRIVNPELVDANGVNEEAMARLVKECREHAEPEFEVWVARPLRAAIELLHAGEAERAWAMLREAWPERFAGTKPVERAIEEIKEKWREDALAQGR
jgi:hypothetical protein